MRRAEAKPYLESFVLDRGKGFEELVLIRRRHEREAHTSKAGQVLPLVDGTSARLVTGNAELDLFQSVERRRDRGDRLFDGPAAFARHQECQAPESREVRLR